MRSFVHGRVLMRGLCALCGAALLAGCGVLHIGQDLSDNVAERTDDTVTYRFEYSERDGGDALARAVGQHMLEHCGLPPEGMRYTLSSNGTLKRTLFGRIKWEPDPDAEVECKLVPAEPRDQ